MYNFLLFDADDTLLDFQKAQLFGFMDVLIEFDIKFTQPLYDQYRDINHHLWNCFEKGQLSKTDVQKDRFTTFFELLGKNIDGEIANQVYQKSLESQTWLIPYAIDVCMQLAKNHIITVVTNGVGQTQMKRLNTSLINPCISNIVISENIGFSKPDVRFFDYVLNLLGCPKMEDVLLIGDSLSSDIQGAINIGVDSCWFNPHKQPNTHNINCNYEISDLRQLLDIVNKPISDL